LQNASKKLEEGIRN